MRRLMAPGGIEPPHAASKAAALSAELRGRAQRGYLGRFLATLCRLGGGSSVGRAPGCGPGGRGFESRPPPLRILTAARRRCQNSRQMGALFAWLWIVGGVPAAVLGEVVRADNPR